MNRDNKTFFFKRLAIVGALAAACGPALALTFQSAQVQGDTVAADYSSTGLLSFDIDFSSSAAATLAYTVSADDLLAPLEFNAVLRNFTSAGITGFSLTLAPGTFAGIGSVTRQFVGGSTQVNAVGGSALLSFDSPQFLDVEIGDALGTTPGAGNWTLGGLQAGDVFSITVTPVPEPGIYAMLLAGLLWMGWTSARKRG